MSENPTQSFADALRELEGSGNVERFVTATFADDAQLVRPETGQHEDGTGGAREFWQQYVDQFRDVTSEFSRVVHGAVGVLEWSSTGHLRNGADIDYRGISVLDFAEDDRVTRFVTYYDTAAFGLAR